VAGADVISVFCSSTRCHTLVYELGCYQSKTTKQLLNVATWHTSSEETIGPAFVLGNVKAVAGGSRAPPQKSTIKGTRKGTKGGKKGQKWHLRHIAVTANNGEKVVTSDREHVTAMKHDFKCQTWQPKDHFEKLLKARREALHTLFNTSSRTAP
jgi:hypothetical protein